MHPFFENLGLRYPLIQAPMAGVQDARLALAVAQTGALGSLPCALLDAPALEAALQELLPALEPLRSADGRPAAINLNFFAHTPPQLSAEQAEAARLRWQSALAPLYVAEGLPDPQTTAPIAPLQAARQPFTVQTLHAIAVPVQTLLARGHRVVLSFHFGLPAAELLEQIRNWGNNLFIIASATTVREALWLQAQGVDAVIAQGLEAGGHRGHFLDTDCAQQSPCAELVPRIVQALSGALPVIAAGGITSAAAVRQAMQLGAAAVQAGTAYLLADEATTSDLHRSVLMRQTYVFSTVSPSPDAHLPTQITRAFTGGAARGILNRAMQALAAHEAHIPPFPLAAGGIAPLRQKAEASARADFTPLWCGQCNTGLVAASARVITEQLAAGFV